MVKYYCLSNQFEPYNSVELPEWLGQNCDKNKCRWLRKEQKEFDGVGCC